MSWVASVMALMFSIIALIQSAARGHLGDHLALAEIDPWG